jgi:hypothetical protein
MGPSLAFARNAFAALQIAREFVTPLLASRMQIGA